MDQTNLPPLDQKRMLKYDEIRYADGYPEHYVREYAQAATQALQREVEELRRERDELAQQRGDLLRRVVELEQDAARLDHIEKSARCDPKMDGQHVWWPTSFNHRLIGPTLRDAIDSARGRSVASDSQPSEIPK